MPSSYYKLDRTFQRHSMPSKSSIEIAQYQWFLSNHTFKQFTQLEPYSLFYCEKLFKRTPGGSLFYFLLGNSCCHESDSSPNEGWPPSHLPCRIQIDLNDHRENYKASPPCWSPSSSHLLANKAPSSPISSCQSLVLSFPVIFDILQGLFRTCPYVTLSHTCKSSSTRLRRSYLDHGNP